MICYFFMLLDRHPPPRTMTSFTIVYRTQISRYFAIGIGIGAHVSENLFFLFPWSRSGLEIYIWGGG